MAKKKEKMKLTILKRAIGMKELWDNLLITSMEYAWVDYLWDCLTSSMYWDCLRESTMAISMANRSVRWKVTVLD